MYEIRFNKILLVQLKTFLLKKKFFFCCEKLLTECKAFTKFEL